MGITCSFLTGKGIVGKRMFKRSVEAISIIKGICGGKTGKKLTDDIKK